MNNTATGTRYIAKCKCGTFTSELVSREMLEMANWNDSDQRKGGPTTSPFRVYRGSHCLICRGCGSLRYAKQVRGIVSKKHICNDKCMTSHGTVCECSCGGKNHGGAYSAA